MFSVPAAPAHLGTGQGVLRRQTDLSMRWREGIDLQGEATSQIWYKGLRFLIASVVLKHIWLSVSCGRRPHASIPHESPCRTAGGLKLSTSWRLISAPACSTLLRWPEFDDESGQLTLIL